MRGWLLSLALLLAGTSCAADGAPPQRLLFVGNSLVYVGNLPATYTALAAANGHEGVQSDMIVAGGTTLSDRIDGRRSC